jgi:hypothetical protein
VPNPANPQSWNRYSYVNNSPINYIDPTGHWVDEGCGSGKLCELPVKKKGPGVEKDSGGEPSGGAACQGPHQSVICLPGNESVLPDFPLIPTDLPNFTRAYDYWYENWPPDGYYVAGYEKYINSYKIDKVDLTIDIAGLVADIGYLTWETPVAPVSVPITLVAQGIEWVGLGEAVLDAISENDFSDINSFGAEKIFEVIVESKAPRAVPLVGIGFTIGSLASNVLDAIDTRPVLKPIPIITVP